MSIILNVILLLILCEYKCILTKGTCACQFLNSLLSSVLVTKSMFSDLPNLYYYYMLNHLASTKIIFQNMPQYKFLHFSVHSTVSTQHLAVTGHFQHSSVLCRGLQNISAVFPVASCFYTFRYLSLYRTVKANCSTTEYLYPVIMINYNF